MENLIETIKDLSDRPSWNQYFITIAYLISKRSTCSRLNVGCIIVKDKRIVSTGYNGFLAGAKHEGFVRNGHEQLTVHSETNAIADASKRGVSLDNSTAYITHFPCINCCKILIASGIKKIVYSEDYKCDELVYNLCKNGNVELYKFDYKNNILNEIVTV